jgi:K319-like protein
MREISIFFVTVGSILLLSSAVLTLNLSIPIAYANNNTVNNQPLITGLSDQFVNSNVDKAAVQQILQQIQSQIAQTSGQYKATAALDQINSIIGLNPSGSLAKLVASGSDYIGQPLEQALTLPPPVQLQSASSIIPLSDITTNQQQLQQPIEPQQPQQLFIPPTTSTSVNNTTTAIIPLSNQKNVVQPNNNTNNTHNSNIGSHVLIPNTNQQVSQALSQLSSSQSLLSDPLTLSTNGSPAYSSGHIIPNLVVNPGSLVTLDGSATHDPDGDPLTFAWTQISGSPAVVLDSANTNKATFTAPDVSTNATMFFRLKVTDTGGLADNAIEKVTITPIISSSSPSPFSTSETSTTTSQSSPLTSDHSKLIPLFRNDGGL